MPDRKKVIKGLEEISDYFFSVYHHSKDREEINKAKDMCCAVEDALDLLKEQKPLPIRYVDQGYSYPPCIYHSVCRACGEIVNYPERFCKACGRGIIWVPFCKEEADVCSER